MCVRRSVNFFQIPGTWFHPCSRDGQKDYAQVAWIPPSARAGDHKTTTKWFMIQYINDFLTKNSIGTLVKAWYKWKVHCLVVENHHNSKEGGKPRSPFGNLIYWLGQEGWGCCGRRIAVDDDLLERRRGSYDEKLLPRCRTNTSVRRLQTRSLDILRWLDVFRKYKLNLYLINLISGQNWMVSKAPCHFLFRSFSLRD